ncbi:MAG TPA: PDZ domain-containing protein [Bacillales bacterium]|nr:PDZ domain-containing protein [Bacillales bacterium]
MTPRKKRYGYIGIIILFALIVISLFYRLPYEVMKPGDAHPLEPAIEIQGAHEYKNGQFMFMTVRLVSKPNVYQYVLAKFKKYHKIYPLDQFLEKGESPQEYRFYQLHLMDTAQNAAIYVAYKKAGKNPQIKHNGLLVVRLINGMPAEKKLQLGDLIIKAEGSKVTVPKDLLEVTKGKGKGDSVQLTVKREGEKLKVTIPIGRFPDRFIEKGGNQNKYGIGIVQTASTELQVKPPVHFDTAQIGGPSAGLMFTLGIYNRLTDENWTKGYKIAGTGTMNIKRDPDTNKVTGVVGPIGGIKEKVVAADKENVEVFFAPVRAHNYDHALKAAKDIGTDMDIVPVKTFGDALDYLRKLEPKEGSNEEKGQAA